MIKILLSKIIKAFNFLFDIKTKKRTEEKGINSTNESIGVSDANSNLLKVKKPDEKPKEVSIFEKNNSLLKDDISSDIDTYKSEKISIEKSKNHELVFPVLKETNNNQKLKIEALENMITKKQKQISLQQLLNKKLEEDISLLNRKNSDCVSEIAFYSNNIRMKNEELEKYKVGVKARLQEIDNHTSQLRTEIEKYKADIIKEKRISENLSASIYEKTNQLESLLSHTKILEIEIENNKVELSNEREKSNKLSKIVEEETKKINDIYNINCALKSENEKQLSEIQKSKDIIESISGILKAQEIPSTTGEVYEFINKINSFSENILYEALNEIPNIKQSEIDFFRNILVKWSDYIKKPWIKDKKVIAFVGEFSSGKSSIVNTILGDNNFLPVSIKPSTAIATYISFGNEQKICFTDNSNKFKELPESQYQKFSKDSLKDFNLSALINHIVIEYNNIILKDLSILDTPGYSSGDSEDESRTSEAIKEADVLIWVIDINVGELNSKSIKVLKKEAVDVPFYIVLNKADTKSPEDCSSVIEKIKGTLTKNSINYDDVILFSNRNDQYKPKFLDVFNRLDKKFRPDYLDEVLTYLDKYCDEINKIILSQKNKKVELIRIINNNENDIEHTNGILKRINNLIESSYSDFNNEIVPRVFQFGNGDKFKIKNFNNFRTAWYCLIDNIDELIEKNDLLVNSINNNNILIKSLEEIEGEIEDKSKRLKSIKYISNEFINFKKEYYKLLLKK